MALDDSGLNVLASTPATLRSMLANQPPGALSSVYSEDAMSPLEIVGHLIEGERYDWMPRARIILEHGESVAFSPFDPYAMRGWLEGWTIGSLLAEFENLRTANLDELRAMRLTPADLERRGTHPAFGSVTLNQLLTTWVVHDLYHVAQIAKGMAFAFRDEIGPWREYLAFIYE